MSGVGRGMGVLDAGRRAVRERGFWEVLGSFLPINFNGALLSRNVDSCVKR